MAAKFLIVLLIATTCYSSCKAALRRTPKVYNALITTDENLTSSRAFPVIQPTIHETGVAHYPFGPYSPYGYYGHPLLRFGQPIAPGLLPDEQLPYPLPQSRFPPQIIPQHPPHTQPAQSVPAYPLPPQNPPTAPAGELQPQQPTASLPEQVAATEQQPIKPPQPPTAPSYISPNEQQRPLQMPNEKLPIPLNEYGLPPSLIPLPQQYPRPQAHTHTQVINPAQLPPYGYNQYPLIYDPLNGFREQYLPPYDYYPSHTFGVAAAPLPPSNQPTVPAHHPAGVPPPAPTAAPASGTESAADGAPGAPDFDSINNAPKSKNNAVPDVPPPPVPSGAKSKKQS